MLALSHFGATRGLDKRSSSGRAVMRCRGWLYCHALQRVALLPPLLSKPCGERRVGARPSRHDMANHQTFPPHPT